MGANSHIEWTHHTFNPWIGCTKVSPACDHCYAEAWAHRFEDKQRWGAGTPRRRTSVTNWRQPFRWAREAHETGERPRVFCASLADVFDNEVPAAWREDLWDLIRATPELDWLLLTKRIGNARKMLPWDWEGGWSHVWLGATVVTQVEADRDIPKLLDTPAAVRWLSMEPLLEQVDLTRLTLVPKRDPKSARPGVHLDALSNRFCESGLSYAEAGLRWIVAGGESGPHARPTHPDWARSLRDQCAAADVPFLFKQWGTYVPESEDHASPDTLPDPAEILPQHGATLWPNGRVVWRAGEDTCANGAYTMLRVGKKAAGRLLDGHQHDEIPRSAVPYMCPNDNGPSEEGAVSP